MKSIFKKIKEIFINICRPLFKTKKTALLFFGFMAFNVLCLVSISFAFSNTKLSINQSISEFLYNDAESAKKENEEMLGAVYGHESFSGTWEICSLEPEKSKELRSLNISERIFDAYPANFLNTMPALVDYVEEENVPISFLLLPKGGYLDPMFSPDYSFDMIVGSTDKTANTEDIYINKKYADFLLAGSTNYSSLVGAKISLPYFTEYLHDGCEMTYVIKGVMEDDPKKATLYNYYKKFLGDFFLANQYLSLPVKSCTLFELESKMTSIKRQVSAISRIYSYQSNLKRFNSIENMYAYEYRIIGINTIDHENNILNIENEDNLFFKKYQSLYNYFFNKNNTMKCIIFIVLSVLFFAICLYASFKIHRCFQTYSACFIFYLVSSIILFVLGLLFTKLLGIIVLSSPRISPNLWQSFLAMLVIQIVFFVLGVINFKKRKPYEEK